MYRHHPLLTPVLLLLALLVASPAPAHAQLGDLIRETAQDQFEKEVQALVRNAVRCAFDDLECIESAKADGEEVVLTDEEGELITDEEGRPVQTQDDLPADKRAEAAEAAASVTTAESDYERGSREIFVADYRSDVPGDFPRRLEFLNGNAEVGEAQGSRALKLMDDARLAVPLPETLPERFTLEVPVHMPQGGGYLRKLRIMTDVVEDHRLRNFAGHLIKVETSRGSVGLEARNHDIGGSLSDTPESVHERFVTLQVMVDGEYAKVYFDGRRVSNLPRATLPRGQKLFVHTEHASAEWPIWIGPIQVHAGGRDLYSALEAEGRVAVDDILFETDEATILPESAASLETIAAMLREHPDLQILIEGHTDDQGDFRHNMDLSQARAEAVMTWLTDESGIAADRFQVVGVGSTRPVASNDTEEGRAQNRRVELVRIGG